MGNEAYPHLLARWRLDHLLKATRTSIEQRHSPREARNRDHSPQIEPSESPTCQKAPLPKEEPNPKDLSELKAYLIDLKSMQITLPTMTFDRV